MKNKKIIHNTLVGYGFLFPNIAGFLLFTSLPVIVSFVLTFLQWDILTPPKFIGLANWINLVKDKDFWYYLYNTFFFMLGIPLKMIVALALALLVNHKLKGIVIFRTIFFLPVVCSTVAIALIWNWIYNPDFGLLNAFLRWIGMYSPPQWLSSTKWAKPAIIIMEVWVGAGYTMLLYLAALQGIPAELYEAADIDGASSWQKFMNITFPMLAFVNFFIVIMAIIGGFQAFGTQYVLTGGGPAGSTTTIVYHIYNHAFKWFNMGYASTIAWFLFGIMFVVTLVQWSRGKSGETNY
ncbi:MAG: hypothetical protein A3J83_01005 [Elusimicrobia bacterium RIFOXYA2_FULL_40_6]|nr:MAG: hypothetical protein A3J83_01005 [Elusimicrobia bacterium RIFOXYA2_FULL_40_6]